MHGLPSVSRHVSDPFALKKTGLRTFSTPQIYRRHQPCCSNGHIDVCRNEVYVGFWELEALLLEAAAFEPASPPPPDAASEAKRIDNLDREELTAEYKEPCSVLERPRATHDTHAALCQEDSWEEGCAHGSAMPPDLVEALGPDATQAMFAMVGDGCAWTSRTWWSIALPVYAKCSLRCKCIIDGAHDALRRSLEMTIAFKDELVEGLQEELEEAREEAREAREEAREARAQLRRAEEPEETSTA
jgi:hypothetical protein